jgi:hypothetical protein
LCSAWINRSRLKFRLLATLPEVSFGLLVGWSEAFAALSIHLTTFWTLDAD